MAKSVAANDNGFHKSSLSDFDASCYTMGWDDGDSGKALEKSDGVGGISSFHDVSHTPKQSSTRSKKTLIRGSSSSTDGIINLSPAMSSSRLAGSRGSSDNLYHMSCHTIGPFEVDASFARDEGSDEATERSGGGGSFHRSQLPKVYRPKKSRGRESTSADGVVNRPPSTSMLSTPPSTLSSVLSGRGSGGKLDHMTCQAFVVDTFTMERGRSSGNLCDAVVHGGRGKDAKSHDKRKNSLSSFHSADHLPVMANEKVAKRRSSGSVYSETILPGEKKRSQRRRSSCAASDVSSLSSLLREIYCTPEVFFDRNETQRRVSGGLRKTKSSSSRSVDMMMDP